MILPSVLIDVESQYVHNINEIRNGNPNSARPKNAAWKKHPIIIVTTLIVEITLDNRL